MFDWLFEGRTVVYILVGLVGLLLLAGWWQSRKRGLLIAVGGAALLLLLYLLCDVLVESDREQLVRKTEEIGVALREQNLDKAFSHVSESFDCEGVNKKAMRQAGEQAMRTFRIQNTRVWDVVADPIDRPGKKATVHFSVKAETSVTDGQFLHCHSEWGLDPDGQWRMKTFELRDPVTNQKIILPIRR